LSCSSPGCGIATVARSAWGDNGYIGRSGGGSGKR
jgi:hypothetical protein